VWGCRGGGGGGGGGGGAGARSVAHKGDGGAAGHGRAVEQGDAGGALAGLQHPRGQVVVPVKAVALELGGDGRGAVDALDAVGVAVQGDDAVARFAADLGAGTLEPALLADHPYVSILTCDGTGAGSTLELIFAIFANVLALTGDEAHARRRTAQHVRSIVDDGYEPEPELSEDETILCF